MNIRDKLRGLTVFTIVGLGLISGVTVFGLNAIRDAEETAHRREAYVIDLLEVKASAISTIMLDPTLQETRDVFSTAEKSIAVHGDSAMHTIKRAEVREELKTILALWKRYDADSQMIIQQAVSDPRNASDQLVPVYNREFKPLQVELEKFVSQRQTEAVQSRELAGSISTRTYWQLIPMLLVVSLFNVFIVVHLSRSLQSGLHAIQQKLISLKAGDLTQRLPTDADDELSEIGSGVNAFIQELQKIVRDTRKDSELVSSAAIHLASASQQVQASTSQQSEATATVATAVEQFSVSLDQVSENAAEAERKASLSGELSRHGGSEVENAVVEIQRIEHAVNEAARKMDILGEQAQEIGSVVNVIKDVAEQTNLLALNAAIEAARAGESGRGFAVVADEVRKLAERTGKSAQEITEMIVAIQAHTKSAADVMQQSNSRVAQGVKQAEHAGQSMQKINESSSAVLLAVTDISSALGEQRTASAEISRNVESIAQMTEENHAAVSEVSSAAAQLKALATELQEGVAKFKV